MNQPNGVIAQNNQRDRGFSATRQPVLLAGRQTWRRKSRALLLVHVVEPIAVAPQWQPCIEEADDARVADARAQLQRLTKQFGSTCYPTCATSQMLSATLGQRRFYRDTPTRMMLWNSFIRHCVGRTVHVAARLIATAQCHQSGTAESDRP